MKALKVPYDGEVKLQSIFGFAREVFPYVLIFYLVLFLLENLFPGFISNNFSLNWVLGAVLALGLLAAFAPENPEKEPEKPVGKNDYLLVAVLGLIGGAIIFAKMGGGSLARWATTAISSILIVLVGLVALSEEKEEPEEFVEVPSESRESIPLPHIHWRRVAVYARRMVRPFLLHRIQLPLAYVLLFGLFTVFLIPKNVAILSNALRRPEPQPASETAELAPPPEPFFWDDMNEFVSIRPSDNLPISVQNGGGDRGAAATFSSLLRDNGFGSVTTGNADRYDYTNAQIRFAEADKPQANIIKQLLKRDYPVVMELPQDATTSGITVILGKKEATQ